MNMKQKTTDELDEQSKRLIENLHKLSNQEQEEFYVAFCEPDDKYEAMMQSMEDGHWKRKLTELREIVHEESAPASPNHEQSKSATETTESGCRDHCTTASAGKQERTSHEYT